ncbi:hypothetical protein Nepgr_028290 [Nepenthes gracilis]|uniref:Uncharacterized protein n=1 Tax=Nepenthes gracilis TaxID=150966 RepID=A0AAD3TDF1_NEPGR|nr:hypothetical protein Nepgr_028290 [Nepenthes gracilis]
MGNGYVTCTAQKLLCCVCCRRWTCTEPPSPAKTREVAENIPHASKTMTAPEIHSPRNSSYTNKKKERVAVDSLEVRPTLEKKWRNVIIIRPLDGPSENGLFSGGVQKARLTNFVTSIFF